MVIDANAYISVAYFKEYFLNRNKPTDKTDLEIEGTIVEATAFIDLFYCFIGQKLAGETQTTEFPRYTEAEAPTTAEIPVGIKNATCEFAEYLLTGNLLTISVGGDESGISEMENQVGEIKERIQYVGSSSESNIAIVPLADAYIGSSGWLCAVTNVVTRT